MRGWKLFGAQLSKDAEIAVEATLSSGLFYDAGGRACSAGAGGEPQPVQGDQPVGKKTDRNDAELPALCLSKGVLREVRTKDHEHRSMSHLAQTRDPLVNQQSALKGKIHNLLSAEGINLKRETLSSKQALDRVLALPLSPILATEARVLVGQIRGLTGSIAELEEVIEEEGPKLAGHKNLISIKGVGPVGATVLFRAIGKIEAFADPGKVTAYVGLVPRVQNSNETERSGRTTKQGNKLARTALVQCSLVAKRYSPYLQKFCQRIQPRRGGKANHRPGANSWESSITP
jgi:transposase